MLCNQEYSIREGFIKENAVRAKLYVGDVVIEFDLDLLGNLENQVWNEIKSLYEKHGVSNKEDIRLEYQMTLSIPVTIKPNQPEAGE